MTDQHTPTQDTSPAPDGRSTRLILLPPRPDRCQECAVNHETDEPHDAGSLHYHYAFQARHGRWPTWKDATAHCPPDIAAAWEAELRALHEWTEPTAPTRSPP